ncbi:amidase [Amphritea pacifica]|uniref:Amidase n=1 Tax=Amphritea pacifica TaxID=2811233 RepID=A0ABS2W2Q9_9GAMM|nr:amidase [Amphritea pacifica]MBN0985998.1 amidase [Amphritea pacifica]
MKDIHKLMDESDATALADLIKQGEVKKDELLEASIERLEQVNPALNAVAEKLYQSARNSEPASGIFAGIPTLIKDLFAPVKEARMTNGSVALGEARPQLDDSVVTRLRASGIRFIGTSTAPEFGTSYTTESTRFGATHNPWNLQHSAGGSSGGAAAIVASRVVPFAHGNDGGGSLRVPASCCGVFGLKPSRGRVPSGPLVGEGWGGMGTAHAITLSVRDSATLLDIVSGADLGAPYASPADNKPFAASLNDPLKPLRIALIEDAGPWTVSPAALESVQHTAKLCSHLGHHVEVVKFPVDLLNFFEAAFNIIAPNTKSYVEMLGDMRGAPVQNEELEPATRIIVREKGMISAVQYVRSIEHMHALGRQMAAFLQKFDLLLTPTVVREPPQLGELHVLDESMSLEQFIELSHSYSPYTAVFNGTGQPAMSVPLYWSKNDLPIGSHFVARFGDEATLFKLARQLEQLQPWNQKVPPINACMH